MQISKLVLQTSDPEAIEQFYGEVMMLPTERVNGNIQIRFGTTEVIFKRSFDQNPYYHFALNIPCNKIEEAADWLKQRVELLWLKDYGGEIAEFSNWNARSIYFTDPSGNIVELIARKDLKNAYEEPFSPRQILSVSEIGIVLPLENFDRHVEALVQLNALEHYNRQPPMDQFRVFGDEEGLLIVVPEARSWYPTSRPAQIFSLEVVTGDGHQPLKIL